MTTLISMSCSVSTGRLGHIPILASHDKAGLRKNYCSEAKLNPHGHDDADNGRVGSVFAIGLIHSALSYSGLFTSGDTSWACITATFEFRDIRVRWKLNRDLKL